jgi:hypothetical protein
MVQIFPKRTRMTPEERREANRLRSERSRWALLVSIADPRRSLRRPGTRFDFVLKISTPEVRGKKAIMPIEITVEE